VDWLQLFHLLLQHALFCCSCQHSLCSISEGPWGCRGHPCRDRSCKNIFPHRLSISCISHSIENGVMPWVFASKLVPRSPAVALSLNEPLIFNHPESLQPRQPRLVGECMCPQQYHSESLVSHPKAEICLHQPFLKDCYIKNQFINNWARAWKVHKHQSPLSNLLQIIHYCGVLLRANKKKSTTQKSSPYHLLNVLSRGIICPLRKTYFWSRLPQFECKSELPPGQWSAIQFCARGGEAEENCE